MRMIVRTVLVAAVAAMAVTAYTMIMARIGSGNAPNMLAVTEQAHEILVVKSTRELHLLRNGETIRSYEVSLGAAPSGHKSEEGDERTPEGTYLIDWRNENSIAHLGLHISYPNEADVAAALERGRDPGGDIMIHGIANGWGFFGRLHLAWDWTNGCIAVTNAEMREIWSMVPNGTPITIVDHL